MEGAQPKMQPTAIRPCRGLDCEQKATRRCSGCRNIWYCSIQCQKSHWDYHILDCKPKVPACTAHHLLRDCRRDLLPTDPQTLEDYGLNKAQPIPSGVFKLFGVYRGLWLMEKFQPRVLDGHMKQGTLLQHITECYEQRPSYYTLGEYFPWLLQHRWLLDGSPPPYEYTAEALAVCMERELWAFLGSTRKAQLPSWSEERKLCANLYSFLLSGAHPGPTSNYDLYVGFGFCVARDVYFEMEISRLYTTLIRRCSFEEFCDAFESSTLVALMHKNGVLDEVCPVIGLPRHFEHIMRTRVRRCCESVWRLKHYLYGEDNIGLVPSIICDYGFVNCSSSADMDALTDAYKTAFDNERFDEMELHIHCIQGRTLEYVARFQIPKMSKKDKKKFVRLMKNPYPLPDLDSLSVGQTSSDST